MKIFITGGTGFLGKRVVKRLLADNNQLYILVRNLGKMEIEKNANVKYVKGTLENINEWEHNLKGMDVVIHMAAPVVFWGEWSMYQELIIDATENILKFSEQNGVKKFIYISSESVLQDKKDLIGIDESTPYPNEPNSYYGKSKMIAEKNILQKKLNIDRIIIRPTFIWGPGVPAMQTMINKVKNGQFQWIDHGNIIIDMVHVDNVSEAIALSSYKGKDKDIFFVTDDSPKTAKVFFSDLFSTQGIEVLNKSIPGFVARPFAYIVEGIWKLLKLKSYPPLTRFDLAFIGMSRSYMIDKIKNELGYIPVVNYEDGLEEMKQA